MSETIQRMRTPEVMELIDSKDVQKFTSYIKQQSLRPKAIKHLFTKGDPALISAYINNVFPCSEEFLTYQRQVMRYATRKTLATYYIYFNVEKDGEIELIDRKEVNLFTYYISCYELSIEAFKYLVDNGSSELVEAYINFTSLIGQRLKYFLRHAKIDDIMWYYMNASNCEKEVMIEEIVKLKQTNHERYQQIYNSVGEDMKFWL